MLILIAIWVIVILIQDKIIGIFYYSLLLMIIEVFLYYIFVGNNFNIYPHKNKNLNKNFDLIFSLYEQFILEKSPNVELIEKDNENLVKNPISFYKDNLQIEIKLIESIEIGRDILYFGPWNIKFNILLEDTTYCPSIFRGLNLTDIEEMIDAISKYKNSEGKLLFKLINDANKKCKERTFLFQFLVGGIPALLLLISSSKGSNSIRSTSIMFTILQNYFESKKKVKNEFVW